ncbi:MAG: septum formation initiator family protein [Defluviitaleaceae bacterium]|nr:septum formation initiator family protein [Defluviitaleaceae bacterium]
MEDTKKPKKRRRFKLPKIRLRFAIFWVLIIVMLSGYVVAQIGRNNELQAELRALEATIARYQAEADSLELQITFFDSDVYIEELARNRLGMVRPNEIVFRNTAAD